MKIYDISQELLTCEVYPGDPRPAISVISSMDEGALYNLTAFSACSHNGTHVDAPGHFIKNGKTVGEMDIAKTVGEAYVIEETGTVDAEKAQNVLSKALAHSSEAARRLLFKGDAVLSAEGAEVLLDGGMCLIGTESQSVGPLDAPMAVHKILLGGEVVLLEGLRLDSVSEGAYFLFAPPINIGSAEGAPCRAVLVDFKD